VLFRPLLPSILLTNGRGVSQLASTF